LRVAVIFLGAHAHKEKGSLGFEADPLLMARLSARRVITIIPRRPKHKTRSSSRKIMSVFYVFPRGVKFIEEAR